MSRNDPPLASWGVDGCRRRPLLLPEASDEVLLDSSALCYGIANTSQEMGDGGRSGRGAVRTARRSSVTGEVAPRSEGRIGAKALYWRWRDGNDGFASPSLGEPPTLCPARVHH